MIERITRTTKNNTHNNFPCRNHKGENHTPSSKIDSSLIQYHKMEKPKNIVFCSSLSFSSSELVFSLLLMRANLSERVVCPNERASSLFILYVWVTFFLIRLGWLNWLGRPVLGRLNNTFYIYSFGVLLPRPTMEVLPQQPCMTKHDNDILW